jgi:hypothetical protein
MGSLQLRILRSALLTLRFGCSKVAVAEGEQAEDGFWLKGGLVWLGSCRPNRGSGLNLGISFASHALRKRHLAGYESFSRSLRLASSHPPG